MSKVVKTTTNIVETSAAAEPADLTAENARLKEEIAALTTENRRLRNVAFNLEVTTKTLAALTQIHSFVQG